MNSLVSIILPARNEPGIGKLLKEIDQEMNGIRYEVIVIDDSTDDTPGIIRGLANRYPVRIHHRKLCDRTGLGTAIYKGLEIANGSILIVMDSDGQHPPQILPQLVRMARQGYDLVMPTRYVGNGKASGLDGFYRKLVSGTLRKLPELLFRRLHECTDPLGGFIMIRRKALRLDLYNPISWKMSLELLVLSEWNTYGEIGYTFRERTGGESKACLKEGFRFLYHLLNLKYRTIRSALHMPRRTGHA